VKDAKDGKREKRHWNACLSKEGLATDAPLSTLQAPTLSRIIVICGDSQDANPERALSFRLACVRSSQSIAMASFVLSRVALYLS